MSALGHTRAHWSGVGDDALRIVLIASEFMPVSLLTPSRVIYIPRISRSGHCAFWRAGGTDQPDDIPSYRIAGP